jgi:Arc/MetJ-type ribon-helix-helix transcriptional regulator
MTLEVSTNTAQKIRDQMATGRYASEDDLLSAALEALVEDGAELRAIEEGLLSIDRGDDGADLDLAFRRLREKHQISGTP